MGFGAQIAQGQGQQGWHKAGDGEDGDDSDDGMKARMGKMGKMT